MHTETLRAGTFKVRLLRSTERNGLPLLGNGVNNPSDVAYSGNFQTLNAIADES